MASPVSDQYKTLDEAVRHHVDQLGVKMAAVPSYLQEHSPLTLSTAENYFYLSTFYKLPALNELVRRGAYDWATVEQHFSGIEYRTVKGDGQNLFIVKKQYRKSRTDVTVVAVYYILNGEIYQSPSIFDIVSARLLNCSSLITQAFDNFVELHEEQES